MALPVLLLPGTLCTAAVFEQQLDALRSIGAPVEVVPFRAESTIDQMVEKVIDRIPPDSGAAVAGFSMGGMVALALARHRPALVRGLALINSNSHAESKRRESARARHLAEAREGGIAAVLRRHYLPLYLHRESLDHHRLILDMAEELGLDCFAAQAAALAGREEASATLRALKCKTLVLGSEEDVLCPPEVQLEMHRLAPHSDLVLLGACGHFSMLERPQAVNSCLCQWYLESDQMP